LTCLVIAIFHQAGGLNPPLNFYDWFNEMEPVPTRTVYAIEINQKGQEYDLPDAG